MRIRVATLCFALLSSSVAVAQNGKKDSSSGEGRPSDKSSRGDKGGPGKSGDGQAKDERSSQARSGDKTNKGSTSTPDKGHSKNP